MAEANKKPNVFKRVARWCREMKSELKKVTWSSKRQTLNNTLVVIACVVVVGVFIFAFDTIASVVVNAIIKLATG